MRKFLFVYLISVNASAFAAQAKFKINCTSCSPEIIDGDNFITTRCRAQIKSRDGRIWGADRRFGYKINYIAGNQLSYELSNLRCHFAYSITKTLNERRFDFGDQNPDEIGVQIRRNSECSCAYTREGFHCQRHIDIHLADWDVFPSLNDTSAFELNTCMGASRENCRIWRFESAMRQGCQQSDIILQSIVNSVFVSSAEP